MNHDNGKTLFDEMKLADETLHHAVYKSILRYGQDARIAQELLESWFNLQQALHTYRCLIEIAKKDEAQS
jgi:hypothetical protein